MSELPVNEVERMRMLRLYRILDSGAEKAFDELTQLASAICETPIALITLVDEHRQWFKSRVGLNVPQTARDVAFCAHAIRQDDELFIVEDASKDSRFADNPLVTSDPSIRFYAGAPLTVADGISLGTLCVIDRVPRTLTEPQLNALRVLRRAVVGQLELRRALADLRLIEQMVALCAWCRSVRTAEGEWSPLADYVMRTVKVTHGMCPACAKSMRDSMATE